MNGIADQVWLNDSIVPSREARVGILDRGFLFGDGVYELIRFFDGAAVGMDLHAERLARSLELARIRGFDAARLPEICAALLRANRLTDATVYLQVTRGEASNRSHLPTGSLRPTVMAFASEAPPLSALRGPECVRAALLPDQRWLRCEIKAISLMGSVLAAMDAADAGAEEAILHRGGVLSEGSSTNLFLWRNGRLITPASGGAAPILLGVSRRQLIDAAREEGIDVEERLVRVEELADADEVMITSSRRLLSAVVEIDGCRVGGLRQARGGRGHGVDEPGAAGATEAGAMAVRLFKLLRPRLHSAP